MINFLKRIFFRKRLLLVFNNHWITKSSVVSVAAWCEPRGIDCALLGTGEYAAPTIQIFDLDGLSNSEYGEIRAMCDRLDPSRAVPNSFDALNAADPRTERW